MSKGLINKRSTASILINLSLDCSSIGEEVRSRSPQETSSIPSATHDTEERIDDLAKLTLSQGDHLTRSHDGSRSPSTPYNPLKRPVALETGPSD